MTILKIIEDFPVLTTYLLALDDDIRGCEVYDRQHRKIGIISEVYCTNDDLTAKYVEIIPFSPDVDKNFAYPFDMINWRGQGPAFLSSDFESLRAFREYDLNYLFSTHREKLITYSEAVALGIESTWADKEAINCA